MTVLGAALLGLAIGAVLGGLGGGGAILTVPALVYVLGEPAQSATTSSLVIVGLSALTGVASYVAGGHVRWRLGLVFGLVGLPATWVGSQLNRSVDENLLLLGFAVLMVGAAGAMVGKRLQRRGPGPAPEPVDDVAPEGSGGVATLTRTAPAPAPAETRSRPVVVVVTALALGLLTGFFGVGGGFVVVPALVLVLGLPMTDAVGTSLMIVALNSGTSLLSRTGGPALDWAVVVPFALAAMAATVAGKQVAGRLPQRRLTNGFAVLLVLVAGYTAWQSAAGLLG